MLTSVGYRSRAFWKTICDLRKLISENKNASRLDEATAVRRAIRIEIMATESDEKKEQPILEINLADLADKRSFDVELPGLRGFQQQLTLTINSENDKGDAGAYKVVFTLCRPRFSLLPDDQYADAASLEGDSHLAITKPAHKNPEIPEGGHMKLLSEIDGTVSKHTPIEPTRIRVKIAKRQSNLFA